MRSKILFLTGTYLPLKSGGIENYVHRLGLLLKQNNFEVEVATLNAGNNESYFYDGIKVNNLGENLSAFEQILKTGNFSICHIHEYSAYGGIEIPWFKKAKEYCDKVFFTFHLPYLTCYKNDFRYNGVEDCSVFTDAERCTNCIITERINLSKYGKTEWLTGSMKFVLSVTGKKKILKEKINKFVCLLVELIDICDEVFVIAEWFEQLLKENGYRSNKIKLLPGFLNSALISNFNADAGLQKNRIVFAGRIQQQKGLHLLCKAMQKLLSEGIDLDVFGNKVDEEYFESCFSVLQFNYKGIVSREELLTSLHLYDFLILPSVFTEMYPMVIQESINAGLPVIASAAKGNIDAITEGKNGFIFDYNDADDLAKVIDKAYKLKREGWQPDFDSQTNTDEAIKEIVKYYS